MGEKRNKEGRFTPEHTDPEILAAVRSHEPAATSEVADEVGMTRQGADRRLRRLRDEGQVNSKKIAASLVWFTPDSAGGHLDTVDDRPEHSETDLVDHGESRDALTAAVDDVAKGWDDTDDRLEARKAAARAVLEYAREQGGVSKQESKEKLYPEYPVDGQNPRTWYRKNIRPVLNEVAEYDQSMRKYRLTLDNA